MYYVYFLKSLRNDDIYIGSCQNIQVRYSRHNQGMIKSTKGYRPWKLMGFEEYKTRSEAVIKERFYKTGQQREILRNRFKIS